MLSSEEQECADMTIATGAAAEYAARSAYDYAQNIILFSSNKIKTYLIEALVEPDLIVPTVIGTGIAKTFLNWDNRGKLPIDQIKNSANLAQRERWGNCGEYASLEIEYLLNQGLSNIDYMYYVDGDHAFCVLNRKSPSDASDPSTWGVTDVWIIDGWKKECFEFEVKKFNDLYGDHKLASFWHY
jgi:hypothetical protein